MAIASANEAATKFRQAERLLKVGKAADAVIALQEACALDPNNAD